MANHKSGEEKVAALQSELEDLQYDLDSNQSEQEELRGIERGLRTRIETIEAQLDETSVSIED